MSLPRAKGRSAENLNFTAICELTLDVPQPYGPHDLLRFPYATFPALPLRSHPIGELSHYVSKSLYTSTKSTFYILCVVRIFRVVVGPKRGPLSLMNTFEELLGRKSSCSGLENREYDRRDPSR
jgi:hypothetical protein